MRRIRVTHEWYRSPAWNGTSRSSSATTDVEALTAEQVVDLDARDPPPAIALACSFQKEESVLLDMLLEREPNARVFALDTHVLFPETYDVWREVEQRYGIRIEVLRGPVARAPGRDARRRALGAEPRPLLLDPQGRPARRRALRARRLDHRRPARPGAEPRRDAEARLGRAPRALEGEPARRLDGRRRLGVRPRARAARQRAPRARLRLDRLHALHRSRAPAARAAGSGSGKTECGLHA